MLGVPIQEHSFFLTPSKMGSITRKTRRECEPIVTLIDPHTNVTVIILGCLHGSPSSTVELENILTQNRPAALVLELCTTRYLNLVKQRQSWNSNKIAPDIKQQKEYSLTIAGGNSRASIALGIASEFQNRLNGFEPGLEFKRAIEYVDHVTSNSNNNNTTKFEECCDIILADREVSETLHRLEDLPTISMQSVLHLIKERNPVELFDLQTAIWGDSKLRRSTTATTGTLPGNAQIDVGNVLFRNPRATQDLCLSTILPLMIISISVYTLMSYIKYSLLSLLLGSTSPNVTSIFEHALLYTTSSLALLVLLALPLTKIMLTERDQHLARGIRNACQVVQRKRFPSGVSSDETHNGNAPTIVVIVGLLHVNNVAKQLLLKPSAPQSPT